MVVYLTEAKVECHNRTDDNKQNRKYEKCHIQSKKSKACQIRHISVTFVIGLGEIPFVRRRTYHIKQGQPADIR